MLIKASPPGLLPKAGMPLIPGKRIPDRLVLTGANTLQNLGVSDCLFLSNLAPCWMTVTMWGGAGGSRSGGYGKFRFRVNSTDSLIFGAGAAGDRGITFTGWPGYSIHLCLNMGGGLYAGGQVGAGASVVFLNNTILAIAGGAGGSSQTAGGYGGGFNMNGGASDTGYLGAGGGGTLSAGGTTSNAGGNQATPGGGPYTSVTQLFNAIGGHAGTNGCGAGGGGYYGGGGGPDAGNSTPNSGGGGGSGYLDTSRASCQLINAYTDTASVGFGFEPLWNQLLVKSANGQSYRQFGYGAGPGGIVIDVEY